ncbi:MAG: SDR family oxidoreductase [Actinomycetota bacterium]|nr:SDR family oxidoreductase [Actinomycetota bacterium]
MAKQARSLTGKVVVITGGARGIGAATASALIAAGARVAIGDLDEDFTRRAAKDLGAGTLGLRLDVTDHEGFTAFLDEVERELGPIDVLINNAGIMPLALLEEEADATTARQIAINLAAVIHGTREGMRRMKQRRSGHIVNVASVAGKVGAPGGATYCATKHGVVGLSEAVHYELRGTGVDISCVMPTIVRTELAAGLKPTRLSSQVAPQDVADAIVATLRRPRFDVFVPRYLGTVNGLVRALPRGVGEWVLWVSGSDQVLTSATHCADRAEYERRAAASAPGTRR